MGSTFPTIQADMKEKEKFNTAAYIACIILGLIYVPMGVVGYFSLGYEAASNVVLNLSPGPVRIVIEVMLLMHLISAFPILINPPCQYFEQLFKIHSGLFLAIYSLIYKILLIEKRINISLNLSDHH